MWFYCKYFLFHLIWKDNQFFDMIFFNYEKYLFCFCHFYDEYILSRTKEIQKKKNKNKYTSNCLHNFITTYSSSMLRYLIKMLLLSRIIMLQLILLIVQASAINTCGVNFVKILTFYA